MLGQIKIHLNSLFNYAVTIISCVVIIVFGISFLSRASVTTTIGENITTNDLVVSGNATTTGAHRVSGNLLVNGSTTFNGVTYTWPAADGTAGQALITNNNGTVSWSTISGGSGGANYGAAGSLAFYSSSGTTATGTAASLIYWDNTNGRLGIGTSSPFVKMAVAGIGSFDDYVRSSIFTATSSSATSTFPYLTVTQSNVGTVVGGTWQGTVIGTKYGGTGQDFSLSTGLIYLSNGSATASTTLGVNIGGTGATSFTNGSLVFSNGSVLTQDNANLFWDDSSNRLGIGTNGPSGSLHIYGGGSEIIVDDAAANAADLFFSSSGTMKFAISRPANSSDLAFTLGTGGGIGEAMRLSFSTGYLGIGTTSPWAKLSVAGIGSFDDYVRASYFIATSTSATSTFPLLTSTQIAITGLTAGSIPFIDGGGIISQNNSNLYWDNTNTRLGISTSTPWAKLSITNSGSGPSFIVEDAASPDSSPFIIDTSGNVGIGTTTSIAKLSVQGNGTGINQTFAVFDSTAATSTFMVLDNGYVGVGTSTPWGRFSVEQGTADNDVFIVADAGTSTPHMRIDGSGTTYIEKLKTGPMTFETNAGAVSWINMNVDTTVATGTIESYTAQLGDVDILTIYGEASGYLGSVASTSVGVGTTTPVGYFTINASTTKAALSVWQINSGNKGPIASFFNGTNEVMRIDSAGSSGAAGNIQIRNGGLCVDSDGSCTASTSGRISAVSYTTGASDLAENYYGLEPLEAGDVIMSAGGSNIRKAGASNQNSIIGVVSTKPGITLGLENDNPVAGEYPVALAGRVPVKVNLEAGSIAIGDPLMISSEAGVAMKADKAAKIIGYALENFGGVTEENKGQILMFVDVGYYMPSDSLETNNSAAAENVSEPANIVSGSFDWVLEQFKNIGLAVKDGIVSAKEFIADKITAKKAAVDALEMKDKATGEVYCVSMENGDLNKVKGSCPEN